MTAPLTSWLGQMLVPSCSENGSPASPSATTRGATSSHKDSEQLQGMLRVVGHMVEIGGEAK